MASPATPPSPLGSGQRALVGQALAKPAAASVPMIHMARRGQTGASCRRQRSRNPQSKGGIRAAELASPIICIMMSETTAPG